MLSHTLKTSPFAFTMPRRVFTYVMLKFPPQTSQNTQSSQIIFLSTISPTHTPLQNHSQVSSLLNFEPRNSLDPQ